MSGSDLQINDLMEASFKMMMHDLNVRAASYGMALVQMKWNKETKKVEFEAFPLEDVFKT